MQALYRDPMILLHDVARIMRTRFDQRARARGMTRAQWVILARLSRNPGLSQNEMAAICEVEPITVGRLIDRLVQPEIAAGARVESRGIEKDRAMLARRFAVVAAGSNSAMTGQDLVEEP